MHRRSLYLAASLFFFLLSVALTLCALTPPTTVTPKKTEDTPKKLQEKSIDEDLCSKLNWQAAAYDGPSGDDWREQAAAVRSTIYGLNAIKVDFDEPRIPACARPLLTRLKHQLRDLIGMTIDDYATIENPQRLQSLVIERLENSGITIKSRPDTVFFNDIVNVLFPYGDIEGIEIARPAHHPELLVVTTVISIGSATDTSLYIFHKSNGSNKLVFNFEAHDYEEMNGAHADLKYIFSPTDRNGRCTLFIADITPWFVSNWHTIRFRVFQFGNNLAEHKQIFNGDHEIYLGNDAPYYHLSLTGKGFKVRLNGDYSDFEDPWKEVVLSFAVNGDSVTVVK